ncbi:MAG: DNA-3-methyladenine glycosylase [Leptolyngbya sp. PLA1]|nr:DNA-3-methyladenine glycosylase [Leptolyngbya sp. PLA1]
MPERAALPREFFARGAQSLAPALLGGRLIHVTPRGERLAGVIVETEAYVGIEDRASHSFGGRRSPRNESMYARPGTAYVYFTYGMHHCFNVVCAGEGDPQAVLVRALEPDEGLPIMRSLREVRGTVRSDRDLTSGPGKLCQAMAIGRELDGTDLCESSVLWIEPGRSPGPICQGPRIGLGAAGMWKTRRLRWWERDCPFVSTAGRRG